MQAKLDDPEVAEQILKSDETPAPYRPRIAEYTPLLDAIYQLNDRVSSLIAYTIAVNGGKPPRITPLLRPVTEVDRARARAEQRQHEALVGEVKAAQERWVRARQN